MKFRINNSHGKGVILVVVLTLFAVISILSLAIASIGLTDLMETQNADKRIRAHYFAMSGIEIARGILGNMSNRNMRGIFYGQFDPANPSQASLTFEKDLTLGESFTYENLKQFLEEKTLPERNNLLIGISQDEKNVIKIVSLGCLNNVRRSITLKLIPIGVFDMAIFGTESVIIGGQGNISGKIGSNSTDSGDISFGNNTSLDGTVCIIDPSTNQDVVTAPFVPPLEELEYSREYPIPEFPDLPTIADIYVENSTQSTINQDSSYNSITTAPNGELIIDTTGKHDIILNCIDLKSLGVITVKGNGTAWLYVSGTINIDDVIANEGSLVLIYSGTSQISMTASINAHSFGLYAPKANVDLGGQVGIKGAVIAKNPNITGQADAGYDFFTYDETFNYLAFPTLGFGSSTNNYTEEWSE